jgi:hypothetical protein
VHPPGKADPCKEELNTKNIFIFQRGIIAHLPWSTVCESRDLAAILAKPPSLQDQNAPKLV